MEQDTPVTPGDAQDPASTNQEAQGEANAPAGEGQDQPQTQAAETVGAGD